MLTSAGMSGYATTGWENFFVAEVGASAALTGLLFVAVSINLGKILAHPQLPGRAGETLLILVGALAASTLGLVPGQSRVELGAELLVVGFVVWALPALRHLRTRSAPGEPAYWLRTRVLTHELATLPFVIAGGSLLAERGGGLYWLAPGMILAFAAGIVNAWVLLVEIQR